MAKDDNVEEKPSEEKLSGERKKKEIEPSNSPSGGFLNKLLDVLNTHFKNIMLSGFIIIFIISMIVSNIITASLAFLISKNNTERKYLEKEGIFKAGRFSGPLYYLEPQAYKVSSKGGMMYLKLNICLELRSDAMIDEVKEKYPRIMNIITELIANKPIDRFVEVSGIQYARRLMMESINRIFETGHIEDIYFIEYKLINKE